MKKLYLYLSLLFIIILSIIIIYSLNEKADKNLVSSNKKKIRFQLQWFDQSQFSGFYVAKKNEYYEKEGLEVEIIPGGFKTNPIQVILMKEADIAIVTGNKLLQAIDSKFDVKAFATVFNKSIACFISKTERKIKTPFDFIGKTVAVYSGFDTEHILLCLLKKLKISRSSVNIIEAGDITPFLKGNVDVWPSYIINEPIKMNEEGISVNILQPDNFGVQFYSDTLFSTTEFWKNNREIIKKFIRASSKGWNYAENHKNEAISIMYNTRNNLAFNSTSAQQLKMLETCCTFLRGGSNNLIFYMNPDRWQAMEDDLFNANIIQNKGYVNKLCDFKIVEEAIPNE